MCWTCLHLGVSKSGLHASLSALTSSHRKASCNTPHKASTAPINLGLGAWRTLATCPVSVWRTRPEVRSHMRSAASEPAATSARASHVNASPVTISGMPCSCARHSTPHLVPRRHARIALGRATGSRRCDWLQQCLAKGVVCTCSSCSHRQGAHRGLLHAGRGVPHADHLVRAAAGHAPARPGASAGASGARAHTLCADVSLLHMSIAKACPRDISMTNSLAWQVQLKSAYLHDTRDDLCSPVQHAAGGPPCRCARQQEPHLSNASAKQPPSCAATVRSASLGTTDATASACGASRRPIAPSSSSAMPCPGRRQTGRGAQHVSLTQTTAPSLLSQALNRQSACAVLTDGLPQQHFWYIALRTW